jgi:integrase
VLRESGYDTRSPGALVFPGLAEGAIRALYARTDFIGRHVPHGWRASFSAILNEQFGPEWGEDIDRALAHSPKDKVEAAYNRAAQLDRRRTLFDRWASCWGRRTSVSLCCFAAHRTP